MNKVILMGRLTKDPETRYSQGAEPLAVTKYTLAVDRFTKKENEPNADFINCVAFGKRGEFAQNYFKKGKMIAVCGKLQIRNWDDANGVRHWVTEVIVEDQYFGESKASSDSRSGNQPSAQDYAPPANGGSSAPEGFFAAEAADIDDDLPF